MSPLLSNIRNMMERPSPISHQKCSTQSQSRRIRNSCHVYSPTEDPAFEYSTESVTCSHSRASHQPAPGTLLRGIDALRHPICSQLVFRRQSVSGLDGLFLKESRALRRICQLHQNGHPKLIKYSAQNMGPAHSSETYAISLGDAVHGRVV